MANQNNDNQRKNRGCGCGGHDEKDHKDHKDHKEHKEENKCKENCALTECEIAQEKMVLYNYIQGVENAVLGDPTLVGASNIPLGGLYLAAYNVTAADQATPTPNTFSVLPYLPAAVAVFPALPTLPTATIGANPAITAMSDPYTPVITGTAVLTDVLSFPNILPAGLTYAGLLGVNAANFAAFNLDPEAVCCWSTVKAYIALNNLFAVLPKAPHVDPVITLNSCDILAIAEYILTKINELCLQEFAKATIANQIVCLVQQIISKNTPITPAGPGSCSVNSFNNGFGLCRSDEIPECGPIFIDSSDTVLIKFLLYAKFLLRSYFITGCDCDITFEHACQFVFGRFCVIDVFVPVGVVTGA
jgi:hypothetical protein